ncbi:ATP-binding cassette domain-containing protein [Nocardia sp. NPDC051463]|uniref:ABC transporter ATP-binding protein n=1 Tax=Nocardia sp. NPDC051463 TaxID=3154845 RepID=UPI00344FCB9D
MNTLVDVDTLTVCGSNRQKLFGPITFGMPAGTVTALTGPSGSGKTTLMRALLGHLPAGASRSAGVARVAGHDPFTLKHAALQRFRRDHIAYVGQDPGSALNPLMRVRTLLGEVSRDRSCDSVLETLELVGLSAEHLRRHPGELSGGQQRRVALARALVRHTDVLVLDEPLAGLHGALRTEIARVLADIATHRSVAILLSGHDTAAVHAIADDIVELGAAQPRPSRPIAAPDLVAATAGGRRNGAPVVTASHTRLRNTDDGAENKPADEVRRAARQDIQRQAQPGDRSAEQVLRVRNVGASVAGHLVLADIDLTLRRGSALAVVGASGAGKTTLARVIAGLHREATGALELHGEPIPVGPRRRIRHGSNGIQLVTQNPRSALNPRRTVAQTLGRPLRRIGGIPKKQLAQRITDLLNSVELAADLATRYPHQLSGGQRQRVALARALAAAPAVLVCDEITSALDHTTASTIMALLDHIRSAHNTALLVITHDIPLALTHCPQVVVLDHGRIVESGSTPTILESPTHNATRELLP